MGVTQRVIAALLLPLAGLDISQAAYAGQTGPTASGARLGDEASACVGLGRATLPPRGAVLQPIEAGTRATSAVPTSRRVGVRDARATVRARTTGQLVPRVTATTALQLSAGPGPSSVRSTATP